jgi:hypothetical protein
MPWGNNTHAQQPISASKVRLIHVARQQTGITEEDFRALLALYGGVTSTTQLNQRGFDAVMDRFKALGFRSKSKRRPEAVRAGMASPGQVSLMRHLWAECTHGEGTDASLGKWLERQFNVSSVRFVTSEQAPKVIGGLKGMQRQNERRAAKAATARATAGDMPQAFA